MYPDPTRVTFGKKTLQYLEKDMSLYLSRAGVMPILIPDLPESELIPFLMEMDGFVFQGGVDIAPGTYHETPIENARWPGDAYRDQYELRILDFAFQNKKPILAICRGFQLTNVYFGGTLYQDLKLQTGTPMVHRDAELYDRIHHTVKLTDDSIFKKITPNLPGVITVNTVHHQGVKTLGKNLVVDAICPDDQLIEAFHYPDLENNFVVAVQWHPEFSPTLKDTVTDPKPLYEFFLRAVMKTASKKG
jgi:putative glutamine amidotransferase